MKQGQRTFGPSPMITGIGQSEVGRGLSWAYAVIERDRATGWWAIRPNNESGIEFNIFETYHEATVTLEKYRKGYLIR